MQDTDRTELALEIAAVRWRLPDGDFAVLVGVTDEGEEVTVTGALADVQPGEVIDVRGAFRRHAKHGWQFAAEGVRVREPVGEHALLAYLGAVKHVGPAGAGWLLERHGHEVLSVIDADPGGRLREVPGIGPRRIGAAVESWREQGALRALRLFLDSHGVPAAVAARVYRAFGAGSIEQLQEDPYALTQLDGIGIPGAWTPVSCTRCRWPRTTGTATSPAPSSRTARGGCSAPMRTTGSTGWHSPAGLSSTTKATWRRRASRRSSGGWRHGRESSRARSRCCRFATNHARLPAPSCRPTTNGPRSSGRCGVASRC
ncbi:MAG: hypothetical protein E6G41_12475 [Actinobacteria bacterium]|nr:MAG: hypothetical protein E6G41_12475 [Actinomycetota bacterium]